MDKQERIIFLKEEIQRKKKEVKELKRLSNIHNSFQLALKLIMNASYGAFGTKYFCLYNKSIASTITSHGRELTKTMSDKNEDYWYKLFHKDTDLHRAVMIHSKVLDHVKENDMDLKQILKKDKGFDGLYNEEYQKLFSLYNTSDITIPEIKSINPSFINVFTKSEVEKPSYHDVYDTGDVIRKHPLTIYGDTDSIFVGFNESIKAYKWKHDPLELVLFMSFYRIEGYFKEELDKYASQFSVENLQDFELEQVSKSTINLAKKMYIKNVVWDEGVFHEHETSLQPKGIDLVRSSSPVFTRERVKDLLKYFFRNPETYNDIELIKLVKKLKDEFMIAPIEDISMSSSCNKYNEKILDDKESLSMVKGTHHAVKAAGLHNFILNQNPEYLTQYETIKSGEKIKIYYTNNTLSNEFAFKKGMYPVELAEMYAPIDYDTQFEKAILKLLNRFTKVLGLKELKPSLKYRTSIF